MINNIFCNNHANIIRAVINQDTLDIKIIAFLCNNRLEASLNIFLNFINRYDYRYGHKYIVKQLLRYK